VITKDHTLATVVLLVLGIGRILGYPSGYGLSFLDAQNAAMALRRS